MTRAPSFARMLRAACSAVVGLCTLIAQDVQEDVAELLRRKDDVEPQVIRRIAATRSRAGAEGLIRAYGVCGSLLIRREIVRALARFAGSGEAEQPALGKLAAIAAAAEDADLREDAIASLGSGSSLGKHFLRRLVDSRADDGVRESALREHVRHAAAGDAAWYRRVWNLEAEQRKGEDGEILPRELPTIRLLAFEGLAPFLSEAELVETLRRERETKIRRRALRALDDRNLPRAAEMAEWVLERVDFPGPDRQLAARILARRKGAGVLQTFLALAKKRSVTPDVLRREFAGLLADMDEGAVRKRIGRMVGKGKPFLRAFALRAAAHWIDAKKVRKELGNKDLEVRRVAAEIVARRKMKELAPDLRKMLAKGRYPGDRQLAIAAISALEKGRDPWLEELAGFASDPDREVRNAAIEQIGKGRWKKQIPVLAEALANEDWSTRFAAVEALAAMRHRSVVPLLIEHLPKDPGRMSRRIAEILWGLTAQPFDEDVAAWRGWWKQAEATFEIASDSDLAKAERARERKRLTERTRSPAKFYGIEIVSHRVLFVIDVSGSMLESMYGRTYEGRPAARIDVARQQVEKAIADLDASALFNVYAFSSGIEKWKEDGVGTNDEESRAQAIEWAERLGASGGTNLYDALEAAFRDPDVDAIYLMSDGEPTAGATIDPGRIREDVAFWNRHRGIVIHTVAIGGSLEILEWLAEDSGGRHVKMR